MKRILFALPLLAIGVSSGHPSHAGQWVYTKIADTSTPNPVLGGLFNQFGEAPTWNGDRVVFSTFNALYQFDPSDASISPLLTLNTSIPDGEGAFESFASPIADSGNLIFGGGGLNGQAGIYRLDPQGALERIVDLNTLIPNGTGTITRLGGFNPSASNLGFSVAGDRVAFAGQGANQQAGIYLYENGEIRTVVDSTTHIPGNSGTFHAFSGPQIHNDQFLFRGIGEADQVGIYFADSTGVHRIAEGTDAAPGYSFPRLLGTFPYYGWQEDVPTFVSTIANVFQVQGGTLVPQFDPLGALPGLFLPGTFQTISGLSTDGEGFVVAGTALDFDPGIWLVQNGVIENVIGPGDVLDGVPIYGTVDDTPAPFPDPYLRFAIGPQALNGRSVVFHATFEGSTSYRQGLYIATYVPEPSTWLLAALGLVGAACRAASGRTGG